MKAPPATRAPGSKVALVAALCLGALGAVQTIAGGLDRDGTGTNAHVLHLPLHDRTAWRLSSYDKIPVHELDFSAGGLQVSVKRSAMPVLFPLSAPLRLCSVRAQGRLTGKLKVTAERQGTKGHDDYALRLGLVQPGGTPLPSHRRGAVPAWVGALSELVPPGQGVARVHFLAVGSDPVQIGRTRRLPQSDLLEEEIVAVPEADGRFTLVRRFSPPLETCGVWLAVDGDDSGSVFQTTLTELDLEYVAP